jgi:hypothetical protein
VLDERSAVRRYASDHDARVGPLAPHKRTGAPAVDEGPGAVGLVDRRRPAVGDGHYDARLPRLSRQPGGCVTVAVNGDPRCARPGRQAWGTRLGQMDEELKSDLSEHEQVPADGAMPEVHGRHPAHGSLGRPVGHNGSRRPPSTTRRCSWRSARRRARSLSLPLPATGSASPRGPSRSLRACSETPWRSAEGPVAGVRPLVGSAG